MKKFYLKRIMILTVMVMAFSCLKGVMVKAEDKKAPYVLSGDEYEFTNGEKYTFDQIEPRGKTSSFVSNSFGQLEIYGDFKNMGEKSGIKALDVKNGNLELKYTFDLQKLILKSNAWNLYEDSAEEVNGIDMDVDVDYGAIIVQTSFDGQKWSTDKFLTNIFIANSVLVNEFYETSNIQLINGCYYRVIVAYQERKIADPTEILFVSIDNYVYRRYAEVYTFYAINTEENKSAASPNDVPKKELGTKIKTVRNKGFSGEEAIDYKDPHMGWDIGTFVINGFTDDTKDSDQTPVFLKNVGDRVTLWFNLKQDIDCLNGNKDYKIESNNGAYDQYFEVPQTNFKRGTLIIRFTARDNTKTDPIVYTNFLEANTRTGANTQVELFEEGDYEVSLDYSITDSSSLISSTNDYKIYFKFKIRNSNCMVFPFENNTGKELTDKSVTASGFRLDLARSRYLSIIVQHYALNKKDGVYIEDPRGNKSAQDGAIYNEEGIYRISVKNEYTNETTEKTIYVGSSPIYYALAKNTYTLSEINEKLSEGGELDEYGNIVMPVIEPEITEDPKTEMDNTVTPKIAQEGDKDNNLKGNANTNDDLEGDNDESSSSPIAIIVVIAVLLSAGGAFAWYYFTKIKSKTDGTVVVAAPEPVIEELKKTEDVNLSSEVEKSDENSAE